MKYTLKVHPSAYENLKEISLYYERQQVGLSEKFLTTWEEIIAEIVSHPMTYQKRYKEFRYALLQRFPYLVVFKIYGEFVLVLTVIHSKRRSSLRYKVK